MVADHLGCYGRRLHGCLVPRKDRFDDIWCLVCRVKVPSLCPVFRLVAIRSIFIIYLVSTTETRRREYMGVPMVLEIL